MRVGAAMSDMSYRLESEREARRTALAESQDDVASLRMASSALQSERELLSVRESLDSVTSEQEVDHGHVVVEESLDTHRLAADQAQRFSHHLKLPKPLFPLRIPEHAADSRNGAGTLTYLLTPLQHNGDAHRLTHRRMHSRSSHRPASRKRRHRHASSIRCGHTRPRAVLLQLLFSFSQSPAQLAMVGAQPSGNRQWSEPSRMATRAMVGCQTVPTVWQWSPCADP